MDLTPVIRCGTGSCPAIYRTSAGSYVIQGNIVAADDADLELAPGEALVEVPEQLIADLLAAQQRPE